MRKCGGGAPALLPNIEAMDTIDKPEVGGTNVGGGEVAWGKGEAEEVFLGGGESNLSMLLCCGLLVLSVFEL